MCNAQTGWGLTLENEILFTKNGIENFKPVRTLNDMNHSTDAFESAAFINEQIVYITCFSSDSDELIVEYTRDSGASWQQTLIKYSDYAEICDAGSAFISFADDMHGCLLYCSTPALGLMTKLLFLTDDAGETFTFAGDLSNTIAGYPQKITAVNSDIINIAVIYHGIDSYLYQTTDGAKTWESVEIFPRTEDVKYVDGYAPIFYGNNRQEGIIILKVMKENEVYELFTTKDAGNIWTLDGEIPCGSLLDYSISDDKQIYLIDQAGTLLYRGM